MGIHFGFHLAGKAHATRCCNGNFVPSPPSGRGRLGWGGFATLGQIKFVQPIEPPSPQPSPAGQERGQVTNKNEVV